MDKEEIVCVYIYIYNIYIYIYIYIYTEILLSYKKECILPFATTWMELEGIMFSEISQRKTNSVCYHLYVESKK